jgi:N12 class adenine-specific DNA methylase
MKDDKRRRERSKSITPIRPWKKEARERQRRLAEELKDVERPKTDLKSRQERMEKSVFSKPQETKKFEDKSVKKAKEKIKKRKDSESESTSEMRRKRRPKTLRCK